MQTYPVLSEAANSHVTLPFRLRSVDFYIHPQESILECINSYQILILNCGSVQLRICDEHEFVLDSGHVVVIKPNVNYVFHSLNEVDLAVIRFDCDVSVLSQFRLKMHSALMLHSSHRIFELIRSLSDVEDRGKGLQWHELKASELVYSLLSEIKLQTWSFQWRPSLPEVTIKKVAEYIHVHYSIKPTLEEISKKFGYTPQHLNKLFKIQFGFSIYQYLLKVQLERAVDILENEDITIEEVADKVGMECRSFFRLFQKTYRISPGEFRKVSRRRILNEHITDQLTNKNVLKHLRGS